MKKKRPAVHFTLQKPDTFKFLFQIYYLSKNIWNFEIIFPKFLTFREKFKWNILYVKNDSFQFFFNRLDLFWLRPFWSIVRRLEAFGSLKDI